MKHRTGVQPKDCKHLIQPKINSENLKELARTILAAVVMPIAVCLCFLAAATTPEPTNPFLTEHRFVTLKFKHICPRKIKIVNKIRGWLLKSENVVPCFYFCCCFFTPGLLLWLYVYTTDQNEQLVYG